MTVVRLSGGDLLLHSPCRPSDTLIREIAGLGDVAHVVAPNWFHDLYLREYRALYPKALFWAPAFLQRRRRRIIDRVLENGAQPPWFAEMPYLSLRGLMTFDECVFFYVPSRTLVVADLAMNFRATEKLPWYTRLIARLFRLDGSLKAFQLLWLLGPKNRIVLRKAVLQMLEWNPDGMIVGHGRPIEGEVAAQLRSAFRWLL